MAEPQSTWAPRELPILSAALTFGLYIAGHFGAEGSYFRPAATPTVASTDLISNNIDVTGFAPSRQAA